MTLRDKWRTMRRRDVLRLAATTLAGAGALRAAGGTVTAQVPDGDREDTTIYKVIVNHERQYSIWPEDRENPRGWSDAGFSGTRPECLRYIEDVWTDMRQKSLRGKFIGGPRPD